MSEFLATYGAEIIYTIISAVLGYIAIAVKKLVDKHLNDSTKRDIAKTVVQAVEQMFKGLGAEEKLDKGITYMTELLNEKGIKATEIEIRLLIEDAVGEFNEVFKKGE